MAGGSTGEGEKKDAAAVTKKKPRGLISRIFGGIFRIQRRGDVKKRLEMISKEEVVIRNRMKNRSLTRNRYRRQAVFFSILLEMIAVASAILAREQLMDMNWKTKALRVLPMFLWPALSIVSYSAYWKLIDMRDEKDQKTLQSLRSEKQGILDDLKEKTKFYEIQQMIQKYDSDPAAKAAAAAVLASKLGADSGLKMYLGDNTVLKSNDSELVQSSSGLRKRKEPHGRSSSEGSTRMYQESLQGGTQGGLMMVSEHNQLVGEHFDPRGFPPAQDSAWVPGWMSQIAAFLVGEDPTQSYAMICSSCLRHNGLVSKEDFHHTKYYCPHCGVLNESKKFGGTSTTATTTTTSVSVSSITGAANGGSTISSSHKEASNTSANGAISTVSSPKEASRNSSSGSAAAPESEIVETTEEQDMAADSAAQ